MNKKSRRFSQTKCTCTPKGEITPVTLSKRQTTELPEKLMESLRETSAVHHHVKAKTVQLKWKKKKRKSHIFQKANNQRQ